MVIDGAADQTQSTALDLVDGHSRVALPEQQFARGEDTNRAAGFKGCRQGIRRHISLLRSRTVSTSRALTNYDWIYQTRGSAAKRSCRELLAATANKDKTIVGR